MCVPVSGRDIASAPPSRPGVVVAELPQAAPAMTHAPASIRFAKDQLVRIMMLIGTPCQMDAVRDRRWAADADGILHWHRTWKTQETPFHQEPLPTAQRLLRSAA